MHPGLHPFPLSSSFLFCPFGVGNQFYAGEYSFGTLPRKIRWDSTFLAGASLWYFDSAKFLCCRGGWIPLFFPVPYTLNLRIVQKPDSSTTGHQFSTPGQSYSKMRMKRALQRFFVDKGFTRNPPLLPLVEQELLFLLVLS